MQDFHIRRETPSDIDAIADMHRRAFGTAEPIPELVAGLRAGRGAYPCISLVAKDAEEHVVGHVMVSHAWLDAPQKLLDVLVLSPLGVCPSWHGRGVGTELVAQAIVAATECGAPLLFVEGDPAFYGSRGFQPAAPAGFRVPSLRTPEPAFQVAKQSAYRTDMTGSLIYRDIFWELDCVGLRDGP